MDWVGTWGSALAVGAAGVAILLGLFVYFRRAAQRDKEVFRRMEPLMEEILRPMRHLADLRSVWPDLTEQQRREIMASSVHQSRFHERKVLEGVDELLALARKIRAFKNWRLRAVITDFLKNWQEQQPDNLKIIMAMVRRMGRE